MATPFDIPQNFSTTLNVGGGIDDSQTTGIILTSVTGLPTDGGVLCVDWSTTIDTDVAEYIIYTGVSGNELTGVTRGAEGVSAKAHSNGAVIAGVISRQHIKRLRDKLTANDLTLVEDPNGNEIIKTAYVSSAVNEITVTNAATGNNPIISVTGEADTGIDFENSEGEEILIIDAVASGVNEVTVTNAATGGDPTISATGDDTNIHLALTGKGNSLVKLDALRQDNTTNSYVGNQVILTGWGYVTGDGVNPNEEEAVTFGVTFATRPIVVATACGANTSSNPTHQGDTSGATTGRRYYAQTRETSTTGFNILIGEAEETVISSGTRVIYQWMAIGTLS